MTTAEVQELIRELSARGNAVRTATRAQFPARAAQLQESIGLASQVWEVGRGSVSQAVWDQLTDMLSRVSNSLTQENSRYQRGLAPSSAPQAEAARVNAQATMVQQAARAEAGQMIPQGTPGVPVFDPKTAQQKTVEVIPKGGVAAGGIVGWLNPSDRPIYARPWFILAAVLVGGGLVYGGYQSMKEQVVEVEESEEE